MLSEMAVILLGLQFIKHNNICWLWLVPTSTTRFASDVGYRMAKHLIELYKEIIFMNNDI